MLGIILPVAGALLLLLAKKKKTKPQAVLTLPNAGKPAAKKSGRKKLVRKPARAKTAATNPAIEAVGTLPYRLPVDERSDNLGDAIWGPLINNATTNVLGGILSDTANGKRTK